ncbi:MAG: chorismate mutase [Pleomorphochaeta sp.]|nr:chorismate mutase [Sphaerochaetaceae bacterium]
MQNICAIRGATTVEKDSIDNIDLAVKELYEKILELNNLTEDELININFTITSDLKSRNPAAALRKSKYASNVPLFCSQEAEIEGMMGKVIRIMILCYKDKSTVNHVYLHRSACLRKEYAVK